MKIKCDLSYFVKDHRRYSLIYADTEKLKTVEDIITFICKIFQIDTQNYGNSDKNSIALYAGSWYIHPQQSAYILEDLEDTLQLKIFNVDNFENDIQRVETNPNEPSHSSTPKEKKKKKKIKEDSVKNKLVDKKLKYSKHSFNNDGDDCSKSQREEKRSTSHKHNSKKEILGVSDVFNSSLNSCDKIGGRTKRKKDKSRISLHQEELEMLDSSVNENREGSAKQLEENIALSHQRSGSINLERNLDSTLEKYDTFAGVDEGKEKKKKRKGHPKSPTLNEELTQPNYSFDKNAISSNGKFIKGNEAITDGIFGNEMEINMECEKYEACDKQERIRKKKRKKEKSKNASIDDESSESFHLVNNDAGHCNGELLEQNNTVKFKHKDEERIKINSDKLSIGVDNSLKKANCESRVESLIKTHSVADNNHIINDGVLNEQNLLETPFEEESLVLPKVKRKRKHNKGKKRKREAYETESQNHGKTFSNFKAFKFDEHKSKYRKSNWKSDVPQHIIYNDCDQESFIEVNGDDIAKNVDVDLQNIEIVKEKRNEEVGNVDKLESQNIRGQNVIVNGNINGFMGSEGSRNLPCFSGMNMINEHETLTERCITNEAKTLSPPVKSIKSTDVSVETYQKFDKLLELQNSDGPVAEFTRKNRISNKETNMLSSQVCKEQEQITLPIKRNPPHSLFYSPKPCSEALQKFNDLIMLQLEGKETPVVFLRTFNQKEASGTSSTVAQSQNNQDLLPTSFISHKEKISQPSVSITPNVSSKLFTNSTTEPDNVKLLACDGNNQLTGPVGKVNGDLEQINFVGARRPKVKNKRYYQSIGNVLKALKTSLQHSETLDEQPMHKDGNVIIDAGNENLPIELEGDGILGTGNINQCTEIKNEGLLDTENECTTLEKEELLISKNESFCTDLEYDVLHGTEKKEAQVNIENLEDRTDSNRISCQYEVLGNNHPEKREEKIKEWKYKNEGITEAGLLTDVDYSQENKIDLNTAPAVTTSLVNNCPSESLKPFEPKKAFYESFPLFPSIPKCNEIIAAKFLSLDKNMCPCYSDYRVSKVTAVEGPKLSLSFLDCTKTLQGQPEIIDIPDTITEGTFDWRELKDVRLIFP